MKKITLSKNTRDLALMLLLVILPVLFLFAPPTDPDFGWHFTYGQRMFETGQILRTNIFSYTMPNYPWANSYWLSELFLYWTHVYLGHAVAGILVGLFLGFLLAMITKGWQPLTVEKVAVFILFLVALSITTSVVRPLIFSTIFLLLLIYILLHEEKSIVFLPVIFLLWANMHADFLLGLFIFSLYVFEKGIGYWKTGKIQRTMHLTLLLLGCFAVTLINPFGLQLWVTLLKELPQIGSTLVVQEWAPFAVFPATTFAMMAIFIIVFGAALLVLRPNMKMWHFVASLTFAILSVKAAYMTRVFAVLLFPVLPETYVILKKYLAKHEDLLSLAIHSFFFLALMAGLGRFNNYFVVSYDTKLWSESGGYPYEAVNYIKESELKGNMFNNYDWGGYLVWQLPQYKTFIDGRMTSWKVNGTSIFNDYIKIQRNPVQNSTLLYTYLGGNNVQFILDRPNSALVKYLTTETQDKWQKAYSDDVSVVLTHP